MHTEDELHLMSFNFFKVFLKILLKRLILPICRILSKNQLDLGKSEFIFVFPPSNLLDTENRFARSSFSSSRVWLRLNKTTKQNSL